MALFLHFPDKITTEPYRLFFPIGWAMGLIGVTYWIFIAAGLSRGYAPLYHGLIQIELFAAAFALGFLLTALPKFLRAKAASNGELWGFLIVYFFLSAAIFADAFAASQWLFILLIVCIVRFATSRFRERKSSPPFSFFLVAFGLLSGALGALFILYPLEAFPFIGRKLLQQGMFLCLSLGIGSFLGPRLMGLVEVTNTTVAAPGRPPTIPWHKTPALPVSLIGTVILASFFIETGLSREVGMLLRFAAGLCCIFLFKVNKLARSQSIVGTFVALALWLMVIGIFVAAIFPAHEVGALHLTYIGGFGALILAIGAQVISSHGGVSRFWQINRKSAFLCAILIAGASIVRLLATVYPKYYFISIGVAAALFDIALIMWCAGLFKYLGSVSAGEVRTPHAAVQ